MSFPYSIKKSFEFSKEDYQPNSKSFLRKAIIAQRFNEYSQRKSDGRRAPYFYGKLFGAVLSGMGWQALNCFKQ